MEILVEFWLIYLFFVRPDTTHHLVYISHSFKGNTFVPEILPLVYGGRCNLQRFSTRTLDCRYSSFGTGFCGSQLAAAWAK